MQFISKFLVAAAALFSGLSYAEGQRIALLIDAGGENSSPATFDEAGLAKDFMGDKLNDNRVVDKILVVRVGRAEDLSTKLEALGLQSDDKIARLYLTGPGQLPKPKLKENENVASKWVRDANVGSLWFRLPPKEDAAAYRETQPKAPDAESENNPANDASAAAVPQHIRDVIDLTVKKMGPKNKKEEKGPNDFDYVFNGLKAIRGIFTDDAAIYIDSAGFFPSWKNDHTTVVYKVKHFLGFADRPSETELRSRGAEAYADALQAYFGLTNGRIFGFRGRTQRQPSLDALRVPFWRKDLRLSQRNRLLTQATVLAGMLASVYFAIKGETLEAALIPAALIYGWSFVTSGFNRGFEIRYAEGKETKIKSLGRRKIDKAFFKHNFCRSFLEKRIF